MPVRVVQKLPADLSNEKLKASVAFDLKLFDSLVNGVIIVDQTCKVIYSNPAIQQISGHQSNRLLNKNLNSVISFEPQFLDGDFQKVLDATPYREVLMKTKDGESARVQVTMQALPGQIINGKIVASESPEVLQWLIYFHDVTLEERLQKKYAEQIKDKEEIIKKLDRKLYETSVMFELAQGMNFYRELSDVLNLTLSKLEDAFAFSHSMTGFVDLKTGFPHTALVRKNGKMLTKMHRSNQNAWIRSFYSKAIAAGEPCFFNVGHNVDLDAFVSETFGLEYKSYLFVPLLYKDESGFLILVDSRQSWRGNDDDLNLLFGIANQLLLAINNNRLYEESMLDSMTGLYNVRYFEDRLASEFKKTEKNKKPLSVIMIDVDFFKRFNDTHGHGVGDSVLKLVAKAIDQTCRDSDTAARYGGEEFVVILPEANAATALIVAERLRKNIELISLRVGEMTLKITASLGAACFPDDCDSMSELLLRADEAMYVAKRAGRNNSKAYSRKI